MKLTKLVIIIGMAICLMGIGSVAVRIGYTYNHTMSIPTGQSFCFEGHKFVVFRDSFPMMTVVQVWEKRDTMTVATPQRCDGGSQSNIR